MKKSIKIIISLALCLVIISMPFSAFAIDLYGYKDLENAVVPSSSFSLDNGDLLEEYVPQGVTEYKDYVLISAYNADENIKKQVIVIFSKNGEKIGQVDCKFASHMGGICYGNNTIYIASTYSVISFPSSVIDKAIVTGNATIRNSEIKRSLEIEKLTPKSNFFGVIDQKLKGERAAALESEKNRRSFCEFYNDHLWVGSYVSEASNGLLFEYDVDEEGNILNELDEIEIPKFVQGFSVANNAGDEYAFLTAKRQHAFGVKKYHLSQYWLDNADMTKKKSVISEIETPAYIESCHVSNSGVIYLAFESGSKKYDAKEPIKDLLAINLSYFFDSYQPPLTTEKPTTTRQVTTAEETTLSGGDYMAQQLESCTWYVAHRHDHDEYTFKNGTVTVVNYASKFGESTTYGKYYVDGNNVIIEFEDDDWRTNRTVTVNADDENESVFAFMEKYYDLIEESEYEDIFYIFDNMEDAQASYNHTLYDE